MKFQVGDLMFYQYQGFAISQKEYGIVVEADEETLVVHWLIEGTDHGYLQDTKGFFKVK